MKNLKGTFTFDWMDGKGEVNHSFLIDENGEIKFFHANGEPMGFEDTEYLEDSFPMIF